jgi:chromosome segregation ATPase
MRAACVIQQLCVPIHCSTGCAQVSEEKGRVDAAKGECLDEISAVVEEINSKIRSRKGVLAPKITQLRAARARHAEVAAAHEQARAAYLKTQDAHTARLAGLEEQVSELQAAVSEVRPPPHRCLASPAA